MVDKVVCISPFHADYFKIYYNIYDAISIDIPARVDDYAGKDIKKIRNRFIFTSIPDRGLQPLFDIWPRIKRDIPDASLVVTSDYRLWGEGNDRGNSRYMSQVISLADVTLLSAVPRERLIQEQLLADIHVYPCLYEELFCLSVMESQVAGVYPITSDFGALPTTNMGTTIPGNPQDNKAGYVEEAKNISSLLVKSDLGKELQQKALDRFNPKTILKQWEDEVFNG
jgi:glycosyltransferase involved in cell wall biosynthesis